MGLTGQERTTTGALTGIKVVDFGQYIAGPMLATMLSDQGADVVHVDPPSGPLWHDAADAFLNRGKRRVSLNLKQTSERVIAEQLIARADVVIENFRPGVMERFGLGPVEMAERHPRLVYCSLPGFARDDPRAALPGWEGVIDAATDNCRPRRGEEPPNWDWSRVVYSALPFASNFAAFMGATAVVMALIARARSGKGQRIEAPLFNAMFQLIGPAGAYVESKGLRDARPIRGNGSGAYRCGDGRYVQFDPSSYRFLPWFAEAAGVSHWGPALLDETELRNPEVNARLHERLTRLFLTRPAIEWEAIGNAAGAALAFIRTPVEWLATDHARASGAVVALDDPELGTTWMPGFAVHTFGSQGAIQGPRHLPDADRQTVLAELAEPAPPHSPSGTEHVTAALEGLRVLDVCQVLAGPTGGRLLYEFGADVIKIYGPQSRVGEHGYLNRGKRSILLDVKSRAGQQVFWKLLERSDIILQNFPPGTAERYGIGYNQVRARKSDVIYASVNCYGSGPWASWRGYERQGQAVTGVEERVGDPPSILGPYNPVDIGTGCLEAFAVALAVFHRLRTGEGQHVEAALVKTATYHQAVHFQQHQTKVWDEPRGWDALGSGPNQRFFQASDGWFFVGYKPDEASRVADALGLTNVAQLEASVATRAVADVVAALQAIGLGAQRVIPRAELMQDPLVRASGLSVVQQVDSVGTVVMPGAPVCLSGTPMRIGQAAGPPGSDAFDILSEVGLQEDLPRLERAWAIQTHDLTPAW
ncbi:MAG TPA: CoA transferase [Chloroflexota bacterium]|nr:CoA transferase [Chloroflexota bacterium]